MNTSLLFHIKGVLLLIAQAHGSLLRSINKATFNQFPTIWKNILKLNNVYADVHFGYGARHRTPVQFES